MVRAADVLDQWGHFSRLLIHVNTKTNKESLQNQAFNQI